MRAALIARLVGAAFTLICAAPPSADAATSAELGDEIAGHAAVTVLDLARLVVPDLAPAGDGSYTGSAPSGIRDMAGVDPSEDAPEASRLSGATLLDIKVGGRDRVLALFDLGQSEFSAAGFTVLALYDLSGKPRLLDAANVASDRDTYFGDPDVLPLGPGDDAVMTVSTHWNSNQTYTSTDLIMVLGDKLRLVDSVFTFDERACEFTRTQALTIKAGRARKPYADIVATVIDKVEPGEEGCGANRPKPSSRKIAVTYRWNKTKQRYVPSSNAFEKMAEDSAKRF